MSNTHTLYRSGGKRTVDLVVAVLLLPLLLPLLAFLAMLVRCFLGSPIYFRQQRPGLGGRPFTILKFRTMRDAVGRDGKHLPDAERLTAFGRVLRSTSLDELPEMINVLRGEMSLVGPRPLLMQYLQRYTPAQMRRHEVRPGITGWAQVTGRNTLPWKEKFAADVWYVDHLSFLLDLKILLLTMTKVIVREGITGRGHATMAEFTGLEK